MVIPPGLPPINLYQTDVEKTHPNRHPKCNEIHCETFEDNGPLKPEERDHMIVYHGGDR